MVLSQEEVDKAIEGEPDIEEEEVAVAPPKRRKG